MVAKNRVKEIEKKIKEATDKIESLTSKIMGSERSDRSEPSISGNHSTNEKGIADEVHSLKYLDSMQVITPFSDNSKDTMVSPLPLEKLSKRIQSTAPKSNNHFTEMLLRKQLSNPGKPAEPLSASSYRYSVDPIDIAILYTSPLIEIVEKKSLTYQQLLSHDDYNFVEDVSQFVSFLKREKRALNLNVERVSVDQFLKVLKKQPKVMHLMCHSEWSSDMNDFCLYFENDKLELLKVGVDELEKMRKDLKIGECENIQLMILCTDYPDVSLFY